MIYGIGIDAVDVPRFKSAIDRWGDKFLSRLFTDDELSYCLGKKRPELHLAGRFAAKVSLIKALGRAVRYKDIEIERDNSGRPFLKVDGLEEGLKISISITHDGDLSLAETIIERADEAR